MVFRNLVSPSVLAANCENPDWIVLDCRFDLQDTSAGREAWHSGHIPGARFADLNEDLSGPADPRKGRHPLPDPVDLSDRLSDWGIGINTQVVAYDDASGAFASRAWWLCRWLGHDNVAVLDGGISAWRRMGLPSVRTEYRPAQEHFEIRLRDDMTATADDVVSALEKGSVILDARAAARFLGDEEPLDARAGHIPGAHNYPYTANLDRDGAFLPAKELRMCFESALQDIPPNDVICMCGSGVTACHNLLAMDIAGLPGARLYPGSWSEWSADPARGIATGPDPG